MSHVFISYSHKDSEFAHKLAEALEEESFPIWIDDRIDYGSQWPHVIQEALDRCDAFIVIMSPRSYDSQWVQNELSRAQAKKKPIFPFLLEGDRWLAVQATQDIDVSSSQLPPLDFYTRLSAFVPRRPIQDVFNEHVAKTQTAIDELSAWILMYNEFQNIVSEQIISYSTKMKKIRNQTELAQAYQTLSAALIRFAKEVDLELPRFYAIWRNLNLNVLALFSLTRVRITNIGHFQSQLVQMRTDISEITHALKPVRNGLEQLKRSERQQSGVLNQAIKVARTAIDGVIEALGLGERYLIQLVDLARKKQGIPNVAFSIENTGEKLRIQNSHSLTSNIAHSIRRTPILNTEKTSESASVISDKLIIYLHRKEPLVGFYVGALLAVVSNSSYSGLKTDTSTIIFALFLGAVGWAIGKLARWLGTTKGARNGTTIGAVLGSILGLMVTITPSAMSVSPLFYMCLTAVFLGLIGWAIGRVFSVVNALISPILRMTSNQFGK